MKIRAHTDVWRFQVSEGVKKISFVWFFFIINENFFQLSSCKLYNLERSEFKWLTSFKVDKDVNFELNLLI